MLLKTLSLSHATRRNATQRDAMVWAISGVVFAVVGMTLVIRYGFAKFLRFWLARLIYEQQAQTDRIVNQ